jgi:hypothetical chaperone protein
LDLTVLRTDAAGQQQVLTAAGVLVGGDDLDSAIMHGSVGPHLGTQSAIDVDFDGRRIAFPEHLSELLDQWQTIPALTRPENLAVIRRGSKYGENRAGFQALETVATQNYGFALFQGIEQAKRELSDQPTAAIRLQLGETPLAVEISRGEFDRLISAARATAREGIRTVIAAAGLTPAQIDVVVATGGSSAVPAFQALLREEVPGARMVLSDLFGSVTGGLAMQAWAAEIKQEKAKIF